MNCNNYRVISLLDTSYKVLSNIHLKLKPCGNEIVREYQEGFRRGKSTVDQTHTVKQIMEICYEYNQELLIIIIKYKRRASRKQRQIERSGSCDKGPKWSILKTKKKKHKKIGTYNRLYLKIVHNFKCIQ